MLTIIAMSTYINQFLPPVSYIKCIDVWFGACLIMIFMAFVVSVRLGSTPTSSDEKRGNKRCGRMRRQTVARISFPVIFLVFVLIFAISYSI